MYEDEDLQEIHEDIIELNEDISVLRKDLNNISASVEGTGENVILNKTAEARFKKAPLPMGNSEQAQYTGRNLFSNLNLENYTITSDGTYIESNTRLCSDYIDVTDIDNLTLGSEISTFYFGFGGIALFDENKNYITRQASNSFQTITISTTNETKYARAFFESNLIPSQGNVEVLNINKIQLLNGIYTIDNLPSYEPYTGGQASPNPAYPQEIKNVGDNINLIDYTTVQPTSNTTVELIENGFKVTGKYAGMITVTGLKENTDYFLQYIRENITGSQTAVNIYAGTTQSTTLRNMLYPNAFNTGNNTTVNIWFYASMGGDIYESNFTFIKLEEGTTMTPYSPYNTGNAQVLVNNKNLFAYNNISLNSYYEINNNTKQLVKRMNYSGAFCQKAPIPVKAGETIHYYFKNNYSSAVRLYIMITDKNMKYITNYEWGGSIAVNNEVSKTKTLPSNATYLLFSVLDVADDTDIESSFEIQVEYNNVKTDFIKGNVQSFVFPLAEGQKLMLGDYLADDGIHHVRGQVILDGSENFTKSNGYKGNYWIELKFLSVKFKKFASFICTHAISVSSLDDFKVGTCLNDSTLNLWLGNETQFPTVESFKAYLAEQYTNDKPVAIECELEEETITPYTSAQQEVYNQIKQAISYDEQTNVSGFSTKVSPKFEVKAFRNMNAIVENLQARIDLLSN